MVLRAYPEELALKPVEYPTEVPKRYYEYQVSGNSEVNPAYVLAIVATVAIASVIIYILSKK